MGELAEVLVPICFEIAELEAKQSGEAVEVDPGRYVQVSPSTVEALKLAARFAKDGRMRLVHATPDLTHFGVYGGPEGAWFPIDTAGELNRMSKERSIQVLRALAQRYAKDMQIEYHIAAGPPTTVILDAAYKHPPDAIVLAASGRGRVRRAIIGSTANKVIRQAHCPVIVVPGGSGHGRHAMEASF